METGLVPLGAQGGALSAETLRTVENLGELFFKTGLYPDVQSGAQAAVKILAGLPFGWAPTYSMQNIYIITAKKDDGTWYPPAIALSAQGMAGLVRRSQDYQYWVTRLDESGCVIEFRHKGRVVGHSKWLREDAERAELVNRGKKMYLKYPRSMYWAGAMRQGVRMFCSELLSGYGLKPPEDLQDLPGEIIDAEIAGQTEMGTGRDSEEGDDKAVMFGDAAHGNGKHEEATPAPPMDRGSDMGTEDWNDADEPRPWAALTVKEEILRRVEWWKRHPKYGKNAGLKPTEKALDFLRTLAGQTMPEDGKRHDVYLFLFGVGSSKDLTAAQASAVIWWLKNGEDYKPNEWARAEAEACVAARVRELGQGELFDEIGSGVKP